MYGGFSAVSGLDLTVQAGEVFGFLGPNGAGKTTTIKILAGLLPPTKGVVEICGFNMVSHALQAKAVTGFVPDTPFLFERLTGREFLRFSGRLYGLDGDPLNREVDRQLGFFELAGWADHLVESYSHGMKKRLAMGAALLHGPKVLIVDEPMVGLDPKGARKVKGLFRSLAARGMTVFLTTHELSTAEAVCDRIGIVHHGVMIAMGNLRELAEKAQSPGSGLEEVFLRLTLENEGEELSSSGGLKADNPPGL